MIRTTTALTAALLALAPAVSLAGRPSSSPAIVLTGNHGISSADVRASLANEPPLFDASGAVNRAALERDLLLISSYYWDRGYAEVKVGKPGIGSTTISIPVDEGHVFTIGALSAKGDLIGDAADNLAKLRIRTGLTFSRTMIVEDLETLTAVYQDLGYAYVNIAPLTKIDRDRGAIDLTLEVVRGQRAYIEAIDIGGNTKTPEAAIRRAMNVAPGDLYGNTKLVVARRQIEALGVGSVKISTAHGSRGDRVRVRVDITQ